MHRGSLEWVQKNVNDLFAWCKPWVADWEWFTELQVQVRNITHQRKHPGHLQIMSIPLHLLSPDGCTTQVGNTDNNFKRDCHCQHSNCDKQIKTSDTFLKISANFPISWVTEALMWNTVVLIRSATLQNLSTPMKTAANVGRELDAHGDRRARGMHTCYAGKCNCGLAACSSVLLPSTF